MSATVVRKKGSVTIPADIRRAARLAEGDLVEVEMTAEGILLRPKKVIDATQAWFWTPAWQAKEREADQDLAAGRLDRFESDEELMRTLDERTKRVDADACCSRLVLARLGTPDSGAAARFQDGPSEVHRRLAHRPFPVRLTRE